MRIILDLGQRWAGLGGDIEQVGVEAEEVGEGALRSGQRSEASRNRGLHNVLVSVVEGVLIAFPHAVGRQPGQVERAQVSGGELGAGADDGRQGAFVVLLPVTRLILAGQVEDHMLAGGGHRHLGVDAVPFGDPRVKEGARDPEHDAMSTPVRAVQMRIVVTLHQLVRAAPEVAPVVLVGKGGGGDSGPGRELADLGLLGRSQRAVHREELVVLILAHCQRAQCR